MTPLDARTRLVTLLGHPVEHSRSPLIHNTAFRAQRLNWAYVATDVRPDDLEAAVAGLRALGFAGANVTIPHKETVRRYLDEETPRARAVGAVNAIVVKQGRRGPRLVGDNTDVAGFLQPLAALGATSLVGAEMVVFGAGGAARAVVYGLLTTYRPARLTLAVRDPRRAESLAVDLARYDERGSLDVIALEEAGAAVRSSRLLVNATPLGMHPHEEGTPWEASDDFSRGQIVYDLVYNPEVTRLLREAGERGAQCLGGLEMLIEQAAAAYVQWTGRAMPTDAVREALRAA